MVDEFLKRGVYDNDYFSGAQVALYIGDIWVDEVTSIAFQVSQSRTPLYGYASELFDDVSKGNVLVQGQFSINFKEAGYLWLVLNRFKKFNTGVNKLNPIRTDSQTRTKEYQQTYNIEQIVSDGALIQSKMSQDDKLKGLAEIYSLRKQASLAGYASMTRAANSIDPVTGNPVVGEAENIFEEFENLVWNGEDAQQIKGYKVSNTRRADDPDLNPFDIYITYGDYTGDDRIHHTIQRLKDVYIVGNSKQVVIDGQPIQETYSFIAKDLI